MILLSLITSLKRWRRRCHPGGFSLLELMLTVAVLIILAGVVIDASRRDWRREQVNAVVIELAGWLETVRRSAIKGNSCTVTIKGGTHGNGDTLAQISPEPCGTARAFLLRGLAGNRRIQLAGSDTTFTFTPAGTLLPPPDPGTPIVIQVALADDPDPQRCLQLDGLLGVIDVGRSGGGGSCVLGGRF